MKKRIIAVLVTLTQLNTTALGENVSSLERERLQELAYDRVIECAENLSKKKLNERSIVKFIMQGFRDVYPDLCIETVSDWYKAQLTELAAGQPNTSDRIFRENLRSLTEDLDTFRRSIGSSSSWQDTTVLVQPDATGKDGEEEKNKTGVTTLPGYITISGSD